MKVALVVALALHFIWSIYILQWRLVGASLQKRDQQEEVVSCFFALCGSRPSKVYIKGKDLDLGAEPPRFDLRRA